MKWHPGYFGFITAAGGSTGYILANQGFFTGVFVFVGWASLAGIMTYNEKKATPAAGDAQ